MSASLPSNFTTSQAIDTPQMLSNSTGSGIALLAANSPASIVSAPYTWIKVTVTDGTVCYVPAWK